MENNNTPQLSIISRDLEGKNLTAKDIKEAQEKTIQFIAEKRTNELLVDIYKTATNKDTCPSSSYKLPTNEQNIILNKVIEILKSKGFNYNIQTNSISW